MAVDVPEGVVPVAVVQVCVAAEHLLDDALDIGVVVGGEAAGLADPVGAADAGEGLERLVEIGRGCGDGGLRL